MLGVLIFLEDDKVICGIDEAGRGPVIGPLVMCGFNIRPSEEKILHELGVNDSKKLTPAKREDIAAALKKRFTDFHLIIFDPREIDARASNGMNLNDLEAFGTSQILNLLKPTHAILDCPAANPQNYVAGLDKWLTHRVNIRAEYKADANHLCVGAASILAKVERDRLISELKKKHSVDFGSGYPSDPKTIDFVKRNWNNYPGLFRTTWDTWKTIAMARTQSSLSDFSAQEERKVEVQKAVVNSSSTSQLPKPLIVQQPTTPSSPVPLVAEKASKKSKR